MYEKVFIHVGQIYVTDKPTEISTVLGSCVSVCLHDKFRAVGAMNHYLLPLWNGNGLQTPKFGNISIPKMIDSMVKLGCFRQNIEAKIFGGAGINIVAASELMVGKRNIMTAEEILDEYGIPIVARDVGGTSGRRILMRTDTGKVLLKYSTVSESEA
jgi:chemotaxis protein CheD